MKNRAGRCGQTEELVVARAALHMWEEPCISGTEGSGAVFFVGCPLGCVFCQNREIAVGTAGRHRKNGSGAGDFVREDGGSGSDAIAGAGNPVRGDGVESRDADGGVLPRTEIGKRITVSRLSEIFLELQAQRANNINLVTPTHYVPQIIEAVREAREKGLHIPIVYNTGSIETPETVRRLVDTVDIFLPDLKFCGREVAERYAHLPDYFEIATRAIEEMVEMCGEAAYDERGMMTRGVIVRHMVLPGHTKDSRAILRYLWERYGDRVCVSIMNQYTPMPGIERGYPELGRRVTRREYDRVVGCALELGFTNAYVQEGPTAEESFIPAFDGAGV